MISYGGGLVGPALIGYVATTATLPVAMLIPAAMALLVASVAPALKLTNQGTIKLQSVVEGWRRRGWRMPS